MRLTARSAFALAAVVAAPILAAPPTDPESPAQTRWWPQVHVKARTIALAPDGGEWRLMPDQTPHGVLSPDGTRVAFLGSPPGGEFEIYVADITDDSPHRKANITSLDTNLRRPTNIHWTHDGRRLVFAAPADGSSAVYSVSAGQRGGAGAGAHLTRLSRDGEHADHPRPAPDGGVLYLVHHPTRSKPPVRDLVVVGPGGERTVVVEKSDVWSPAWSPDGRSIAYGKAGALLITHLPTGRTREFPLDEISDRLYAHFPPHISWRPDGRAVAMIVAFAGGVAVGFGEPAPEAPPPFEQGKIFLLAPDEPAGERFSWLEAPRDPLRIDWVAADDAQNRGTIMKDRD